MISLNEYFNLLAQHDWHYDYSDNHRIWEKGFIERKKLVRLTEESRDHKELYDIWYAHKYHDKEPPILKVEAVGTAIGRKV